MRFEDGDIIGIKGFVLRIYYEFKVRVGLSEQPCCTEQPPTSRFAFRSGFIFLCLYRSWATPSDVAVLI